MLNDITEAEREMKSFDAEMMLSFNLLQSEINFFKQTFSAS